MPSGRFVCSTLVGLLLLSGCSSEPPADIVLTGGRVYTLSWGEPATDGTPAADAPYSTTDGWSPDATAVALRDGEIVAVGDDAAVEAFVGSSTEVVDLAGATVFPGFIESHAHVVELGTNLNQVDLMGVETAEEAIELVAARAADTPAGEWVLGAGWDEGAWANNYPTMEQLTKAIPDHPVWLRGLHGFAGWGNQLAFEAAGITGSTEPPVGGRILLDESGEPSGILLNRAVPLLDQTVPAPTPEQLQRWIVDALNDLARHGYTMVHEAGARATSMDAFQALEDSDELPIRLYALLYGRDADLLAEWAEKGPDTDTESMLRTRSVKGYYDAALGSRGARMIEDYSDRPGHRGMSGEDYAFDEESIEATIAAGFTLGIHAIGDGGNREVLDLYEGFFDRHPEARQNRHRVEHAQIVHPDDFERFGAMNLIASMEPPHVAEDMAWAEARVGMIRIRGGYAWRTMREVGAGLIFNSDLPGSDWSPFYGIHSAITRTNKAGQPEGGWYPEQVVTIEEALRAYTSWGAYASFVEDRTGSIEPARWADLTVVDIDPFQLAAENPRAIMDGSVLMTIVRGDFVYRR